jgi:putative ABC transport system ATP-binding protein
MTPAGLSLAMRRVRKEYRSGADTGIVLEDIDLEIPAGDHVVIFGRSGSGKSTLLNLLGALDRPTAGQVLANGHDLGTMREPELAELRRRRLGFVFQAFNLIPTLTVEENLLVPLQLNGVGGHTAAGRVSHLLAQAGLDGYQARFPEELSGGEQQRVAVLRAIAHEPDVVIADEPTGNLDLKTARQTLDLLESFAGGGQRSLIMATHSREVMGRARRTLEIRGGRLRSAAPSGGGA